MKPITAYEVFLEIVKLIASCYVSYLAASAVLAAIAGITGYLLAYSAALGAVLIFNVSVDASVSSIKFVNRKVDQFIARRRTAGLKFYVDIEC